MYKVGQILYTIVEEQGSVIPIQIVEHVTTKTLEGEVVKFKGILPGSNKPPFDLSKLKNKHESLDEVNTILTNNALKSISKIIESAKNLKIQYFMQEEEEVQPEDILETQVSNEIDECNIEPEHVKIDLGDGITAKISPDNLNEIFDKKKL